MDGVRRAGLVHEGWLAPVLKGGPSVSKRIDDTMGICP